MSVQKIMLSKYQIEKIKHPYKRQEIVRIRIHYDQLLNGEHEILLTDKQRKKVEKCKKEKKGLELDISYEQLKINYSGGFLPLIFACLGALGALIGGGASIATAIINSKNKQAELNEQQRHNKIIEELEGGVKHINIGKGLKKEQKVKITRLTNFDIDSQVKKLRIKNFRGVFIRTSYHSNQKQMSAVLLSYKIRIKWVVIG